MRALCALFLFLSAFSALAQKAQLFGDGKPPTFREEDTDRRFSRSRISRALELGTQDPNCVQLVGGMLTALAETAPTLHRRDENFFLEPHLLDALGTQLTSPRFPANAYLALMVRRVLIDQQLPEAWLATAEALNAKVRIIDLAKLRYLSEGVRPIDSFYFSLPVLRERYELEVLRANSASRAGAIAEFRDTYLDRDVAWGGLTFIDVGPEKPAKKKGKKIEPPGPQRLVALLEWEPPTQQNQLMIFAAKKPPPVQIFAKLSERQYLELSQLPKGRRVQARGRLWEINKGLTQVELRDAVIFEDRDFSQGVLLADPRAVAACPLAVNELSGSATPQPGGFGQRLGGP